MAAQFPVTVLSVPPGPSGRRIAPTNTCPPNAEDVRWAHLCLTSAVSYLGQCGREADPVRR